MCACNEKKIVASYADKDKFSDEDLCRLERNGDSDAADLLLNRYSSYVRHLARPYYLVGGDNEDLFQEGMIGLLNAIRQFSPDRDASFQTFAKVCIVNRLLSALKCAARDKHIPLNSYLPLKTPFFRDQLCDPEELVIGKEDLTGLLDTLNGLLSGFETLVLDLYLDGLSYSEMSKKLSKPTKSIENAVFRIRKKIEKNFLSKGDNRS